MGLFEREGNANSCRKCEHWGGDIAAGHHAYCVRGDRLQVTARAEFGCAFWVRATGADDGELKKTSQWH
jgi:hypothetical protein